MIAKKLRVTKENEKDNGSFLPTLAVSFSFFYLVLVLCFIFNSQYLLISKWFQIY